MLEVIPKWIGRRSMHYASFFFKFICFEKEKELGGAEIEGDRRSKVGSEPNVGLELTDCEIMTREIMTRAEAGHLTD